MPRTSRTTARVRAQAIGLTVLAHAVVVLLLVWLERRAPHRIQKPELQFVGIWPDVRSESRPVPIANAAKRTAQNHPQSLPLEPPAPGSPQQEATGPAQQSAPSPIDWNTAAKEAAARFAGNTGGQATFSPAPQAMRKSCKPRRFDAATQGMMTRRLPPPPDPDSVGPTPTANCIVVGGYPKCVQKIRIRPRPSLLSVQRLEERVADKTSAPSVSSPDVCD